MSALGLMLLLATEAAGTPAPDAPKPATAPAPAPAPDACKSPPAQDQREIVICAQKPNGYRLNPDVMEARREIRSGGRPKRPENFKHDDCASVGPMGCRGGPVINLVAAALTAAEMAKRVAEGKEIGSMFKTTPEPTEYELYLEAKKRREAKEAEAAAKTKAAVSPAPPKPTQSGTEPR